MVIQTQGSVLSSNFPVAVQNTGKCVILQVDGSVEVCRVTISRYL